MTTKKKNRLISVLKSSLLHVPENDINIIKLYYDDDNEENKVDVVDIDNLFK